MVRPAVATCGAFAVATVRAIRARDVRLRATLNRQVLRAGERAEVHGVLQHLALVVQAADVDHERDGGEEDDDGERGQDGDGAVFVLQPVPIMLLPLAWPRRVIALRTSTPTASGDSAWCPDPERRNRSA